MTRPDDDREVADSADPEEEFEPATILTALPLEAEPADVLEQAQDVPADEDDYR